MRLTSMWDFSGFGRRASFGVLFISLLSGCDGQWWHNIPGYNGEWWSRGRPKSVDQLLTTSEQQLDAAAQADKYGRKELLPLAKNIRESLASVQSKLSSAPSKDAVQAELAKTVNAMLPLEGKLSIGSRAAYGELSGELRSFVSQVESGQNISDPAFAAAFNLYTARTFFFLANELSVPAPFVVSAS
ncbi:MAG: hypothetical protein U0136_04485 [Bdellovibrionota bacterium]